MASVRDFDRALTRLFDPDRGPVARRDDADTSTLQAEIEKAHRRLDVLVDLLAEQPAS